MTIVSLVPILIFRKAPPTVKELTPRLIHAENQY